MKRNLSLVIIILLVFGLMSNSWAKELKIGFADKLKILFEYEQAKELNKTLEKENENAKEQFDKKAKEIKKIRDEMELLSKNARKKKQAELENKLRDLDNFRREKQREIGRKYDDGIRDISKKIADVCERYGKNNGYSAILDTRATLYVPSSLDVTDEILKQLNK